MQAGNPAWHLFFILPVRVAESFFQALFLYQREVGGIAQEEEHLPAQRGHDRNSKVSAVRISRAPVIIGFRT